MKGPDFADNQRVSFPQQTLSKFVHRYPELNPHCRNTFRFQHTRLIALASTVTMIINSVDICLCQKGEEKKKKRSFANQGCLLFI